MGLNIIFKHMVCMFQRYGISLSIKVMVYRFDLRLILSIMFMVVYG